MHGCFVVFIITALVMSLYVCVLALMGWILSVVLGWFAIKITVFQGAVIWFLLTCIFGGKKYVTSEKR